MSTGWVQFLISIVHKLSIWEKFSSELWFEPGAAPLVRHLLIVDWQVLWKITCSYKRVNTSSCCFHRIEAKSDEPKIPRKWKRECLVPSCKSSGNSGWNSPVYFFGFPLEPELKTRWIEILRLDPTSVKRISKICSRHFEIDQFEDDRSNPRWGTEELKQDYLAVRLDAAISPHLGDFCSALGAFFLIYLPSALFGQISYIVVVIFWKSLFSIGRFLTPINWPCWFLGSWSKTLLALKKGVKHPNLMKNN